MNWCFVSISFICFSPSFLFHVRSGDCEERHRKKAKTIYEIVSTVLLHLVCAKADHIDPNQMRGLLSPFIALFDVNFLLLSCNAIVNQSWDLHRKVRAQGIRCLSFCF